MVYITPLTDTNATILLVIQTIMVILILSGNILILIAIRQSSSMRKISYYFIGNLAVADIIFGLALGMRLILHVANYSSTASCIAIIMVAIVTGLSSATGICFLCLESYLSVRHIMIFKTSFTPKTAWFLIMSSWLCWSIVGCLAVVNPNTDTIAASECYFVNDYFNTGYLVFVWILLFCLMFAIIILEVQTLYHIRKHFKNMVSATIRNGMPSQSDQQKRLLKKINSMSHLIAAILICYIMTWGPYTFGLMLITTCDHCGVNTTQLHYLIMVVSINSAANVIIYVFKSKEFRDAFKRIFGCRSVQVDTANENTVSMDRTISR